MKLVQLISLFSDEKTEAQAGFSDLPDVTQLVAVELGF